MPPKKNESAVTTSTYVKDEVPVHAAQFAGHLKQMAASREAPTAAVASVK